MSAEDRRRVSAEMMARIDAVVSGHELQRSAEAAPQYVGRVEDRPLRFDEEHLTSLRHVEPGVWRVVDGVEPPPYGRCPCGAHLEPEGSFLVCPECMSTFRLTENGWQGPPWTIEEDGRFFGRITADPATPDTVTPERGIRGAEMDFVIFDEVSDGPEATTAFFEGVDRARQRFAPTRYPPEGELVDGGIEATGPLTVTLPLGLPPGVTVTAVMRDTPADESFSALPAPETPTASRDAYEGTLRGWLDRIVDAWGSASIDARLRFLSLLDRDDR